MGFLSGLFGGKPEQEPDFDIEKAVGEYLLNLPQCSSNVVAVSPRYGNEHYNCEVVVNAADLLPWAEHHADGVWSSDDQEQAARKALPIWLRGFAPDDEELSYVPMHFSKVLEPYVSGFFERYNTETYCIECGSFVDEVLIEKRDERQSGDWHFWTDIWKCDAGHQLYYEEHEMHLHVRR